MSSDLDIGDVEKEQFNSDYSSSGGDSKGSSEQITDLKEKENEEKKANENQQANINNQGNQEVNGSDSKGKINQMINGNNENTGQKINEINLDNKDEKKSSKANSKQSKSNNQENIPGADINNKNSNIQEQKEFNRFFIPQYNKRLETIMNIETESSDEETNVNEMERMKKEVEIIKKEKEAKRKFHKINDINFKIQGFPKNYMDSKRINELSYQRDKIKYLEEKNLELDRLNQMYYDFIRSTNLEVIKNEIDNNNYTKYLKLQSLDGVNDNNMNMNQIPNPLNNFSQDNLDFAIKSFIEVERNKNIHNFNDSMIDINQKITNYLIDNCQEEKEKNKRLQDFKNEIGQKLDKIEYIQKQQKHDIDYIIKYGLNKNNDLNPIVGLFNDYIKPLPKLLKDIDEDEHYEKINKTNLIPYKNFYLNGRYSNKNYEEDSTSDTNKNRNSKILQRTGSCIFENRKNPFYYKLKESEEYKDLNPNIKRSFFDNKKNSFTKEKIEKKKNKYDDTSYEDEEFQKFVAYKGRFFIPADFKFGNFKERRKKNNIFKKNKNEIDFII